MVCECELPRRGGDGEATVEASPGEGGAWARSPPPRPASPDTLSGDPTLALRAASPGGGPVCAGSAMTCVRVGLVGLAVAPVSAPCCGLFTSRTTVCGGVRWFGTVNAPSAAIAGAVHTPGARGKRVRVEQARGSGTLDNYGRCLVTIASATASATALYAPAGQPYIFTVSRVARVNLVSLEMQTLTTDSSNEQSMTAGSVAARDLCVQPNRRRRHLGYDDDDGHVDPRARAMNKSLARHVSQGPLEIPGDDYDDSDDGAGSGEVAGSWLHEVMFWQVRHGCCVVPQAPAAASGDTPAGAKVAAVHPEPTAHGALPGSGEVKSQSGGATVAVFGADAAASARVAHRHGTAVEAQTQATVATAGHSQGPDDLSPSLGGMWQYEERNAERYRRGDPEVLSYMIATAKVTRALTANGASPLVVELLVLILAFPHSAIAGSYVQAMLPSRVANVFGFFLSVMAWVAPLVLGLAVIPSMADAASDATRSDVTAFAQLALTALVLACAIIPVALALWRHRVYPLLFEHSAVFTKATWSKPNVLAVVSQVLMTLQLTGLALRSVSHVVGSSSVLGGLARFPMSTLADFAGLQLGAWRLWVAVAISSVHAASFFLVDSLRSHAHVQAFDRLLIFTSEALYLSVFSSYVSVLHCVDAAGAEAIGVAGDRPAVHPAGTQVMADDTSVECWTGAHSTWVTIALVLVVNYTGASVLGFFGRALGHCRGSFYSGALHIRLLPYHAMMRRELYMVLVLVVLLTSQARYVGSAAVLLVSVAEGLSVHVIRPCSVPWVNTMMVWLTAIPGSAAAAVLLVDALGAGNADAVDAVGVVLGSVWLVIVLGGAASVARKAGRGEGAALSRRGVVVRAPGGSGIG